MSDKETGTMSARLLIQTVVFFVTVSAAVAGGISDDAKKSVLDSKEAIRESGKNLKKDFGKSGRMTIEAMRESGREMKESGRRFGVEIWEGFKRNSREIRKEFGKK